jgi:glycosyltransferase involved in cell wall biosynthesis
VTSEPDIKISLLTAGKDRPYALGLGSALAEAEVELDFIGSDEVSSPELQKNPRVHFLNLRGEQSSNAPFSRKLARILVYYFRLLAYAVRARPRLFHILWNNKIEYFDRTALILYYKLLGKKIAFTAHNVNVGKRDDHDTFLNRLTLKIQYRLCDHIFVHTRKMAEELISDFSVSGNKISVIPLGLSNSIPNTSLTTEAARAQLGFQAGDKVLLFFGQIAAYKGLEYLLEAFFQLARADQTYRLIIVGRPKGKKEYWEALQQKVAGSGLRERITQVIDFIPEPAIELYYKAADVSVLPYNHIFQSGVLFVGYSFGLPVIASDVGSFREEIVEDKTGYIFPPRDTAALMRAIERYFHSDLYARLPVHRAEIQAFVRERCSWSKVTAITKAVYVRLLQTT